MTKYRKNKKKRLNFIKKLLEIRVIKKLRTIPLTLETMQKPIIKPRRSSLGPGFRKK